MASMIFKTKIKGETLRYKKLKKLDGKEVKVVITEIERRGKRKWNYLSSVSLGGTLDKINVRGFAYE